MEILKVFERDKLPAECVFCGKKTEGVFVKKKWKINYKKKTRKRITSFFGKLRALASPMGVFFVRAGDHNSSVKVTLPMCSDCKKANLTLEPIEINWNRKYMVFETKIKND